MNIQDLATRVNKVMLSKYGEAIANYKLRDAIAEIFSTIKEVSTVEEVKIKGFGTFGKITVKSRRIRNPITAKLPNGEIEVPEHDCPKFYPSPSYRLLLRYGQVEGEQE